MTDEELSAALALDPESHDDAELIVKLWPRLAAELRRTREALQAIRDEADRCSVVQGNRFSKKREYGYNFIIDKATAALEEPSDV